MGWALVAENTEGGIQCHKVHKGTHAYEYDTITKWKHSRWYGWVRKHGIWTNNLKNEAQIEFEVNIILITWCYLWLT